MENTPKQTIQRTSILQALAQDRTHPRARELYRKVKRRIPNISLATVYRNLSLLRDQGLIQEIVLDKDATRWDGNIAPHGHFYCLRCRSLEDLEVPELTDIKTDLETHVRGKVLSQRLEFWGLCFDCRSGKAGNKYKK